MDLKISDLGGWKVRFFLNLGTSMDVRFGLGVCVWVCGVYTCKYPDSKIHGANMGPTWVLSAPGGPQVGPMNLAIRVAFTDSMETS